MLIQTLYRVDHEEVTLNHVEYKPLILSIQYLLYLIV
jgi:hypothetical protein